MVRFLGGLYIDPVYVLIVNVAMIAAFLVAFAWLMLSIRAILEASKKTLDAALTSMNESDATKIAREAANKAASAIQSNVDAQMEELRKMPGYTVQVLGED